ncbi:deoxyribodipyrimidine photo-lyase [Chrysiogenes arsenatis]|uniref:deoxyribodipyrimidine photo-lyase n=1 Tax=Chrysiogenes arsenatis TaxID=309797 RepID=UPI00040BABD8|nr:deoxyribodipyrimidine photo-lyase [Chrysiogenes arsenatis]
MTRRLRYWRATSTSGEYVLYWMQAAQRAWQNAALEYALERARVAKLPLIVAFVLNPHFPNANQRHFKFLLEGLADVETGLGERAIPWHLAIGDPIEIIPHLARRAALLVCDCGYLRLQRQWRQTIANALSCEIVEVEGEVVVPVTTAYPKEAYTAAVLRPKIHQLLPHFLLPLHERETPAVVAGFRPDLPVTTVADAHTQIGKIASLGAIAPIPSIRGGQRAARDKLSAFIATKLDRYATQRNDPNADATSGLSPYLHFGHISPLEIALAALDTGSAGTTVFLEELIVRRELAMNMAWYNPKYDSLDALHPWVQENFARHTDDEREMIYTREEWEAATTHDPYWNAAQHQLIRSGTIHGMMRMYWGKKLIEWSTTYQDAFATAVHLNDSYALDGRDPNGYAGILWCFGKHDRPWQRRPVFGTIRYMNAAGLKRKFDAESYVRRYS